MVVANIYVTILVDSYCTWIQKLAFIRSCRSKHVNTGTMLVKYYNSIFATISATKMKPLESVMIPDESHIPSPEL